MQTLCRPCNIGADTYMQWFAPVGLAVVGLKLIRALPMNKKTSPLEIST